MHLLGAENQLLLREKELFGKIFVEMNNKRNTLNNKVKYDKLMYNFKNKDRIPVIFNGFNCPLVLIRKTKDGSVDLEKAKKKEEKFRSNLSQTTTIILKCFTMEGKKS